MKGLDFAMRVRGVSRKVADAYAHGAFLTFGAVVFGAFLESRILAFWDVQDYALNLN